MYQKFEVEYSAPLSLGGCEMLHHIHIFGASGAGTSTLGRKLAAAIGGCHLDVDDYYWLTTDPPFTEKRDPEARVQLIEHDIRGISKWVLSGSICSWGDPLLHHFTLAIFLYLDSDIRIARMLEREQRRYGDRILPGGDMHTQHCEFIEWARSYDTATAPVRSLDLHQNWMRKLKCPIIQLDTARSTGELVGEILDLAQP